MRDTFDPRASARPGPAQALRRFLHGEQGAITVDWVVLTAMVIGLSLVVIVGVNQATVTVGPKINDSLMTAEVATFPAE